jgi:hypothetical protein
MSSAPNVLLFCRTTVTGLARPPQLSPGAAAHCSYAQFVKHICSFGLACASGVCNERRNKIYLEGFAVLNIAVAVWQGRYRAGQ